jgi:DNA-binding transcriptional LysR family regulator
MTEEQFAQLANRIKGQGESVTGELVVTSIDGLSGLLGPVLTGFQHANPGVIIRFLTDTRVFRLDYGEAHVAIRAGAAPEEPDNVVQPLVRLRVGLYASAGYRARRGLPASGADLGGHDFVCADNAASRAPFYRWLRERVPAERMTFRASEGAALDEAVRQGAGLGFMQAFKAEPDPGLIEVLAPRPEWEAPLWLVTHVDLHRTRKVQAFVAHLKTAARDWPV